MKDASDNRVLRRERAQLSCDRCKRLKRKCSRILPCSECLYHNQVCSFQRAQITSKLAKEAKTQQSGLRKKRLSSRKETAKAKLIDQPTNSIFLTPPHSTVSSIATTSSTNVDDLQRLERLVGSPNTFHHIVSIWRREQDWYHEIVDDSPFSMAIEQSHLDMETLRRYAGVIYAIVALVAQSHPSELDAILIHLDTKISSSESSRPLGFISAEDIGRVAEQAAREWLSNTINSSEPKDWNADVFQSSLLIAKHHKFVGRWTEYRDSITRDIGRLQRAKYNCFSNIVENKKLSKLEMCARYRTFWHYFTSERMSSLFDGIPYGLQARNSDMWLLEGDKATHIHTLCAEKHNTLVDNGRRPPISTPSDLRHNLSPCAQLMARLAAQAGRSQDLITSLSSSSNLSSFQRFEQADATAAEIDIELSHLDSQVRQCIMSTAHRFFISIALARVRRDIAVQICESLESCSIDAQFLNSSSFPFTRRRLDMAKALIHCASIHAGHVSLRIMAEPFFTLFIRDPVLELAKAFQEYSEYSMNSQDEASLDYLHSAIIGRNLIIAISKQSELALNRSIAKEISQLLGKIINSTLSSQGENQSVGNISEPDRLVSPETVIELINVHRKGREDASSKELQKAEDVLDWVASLPALQQIFQLSSNKCGPQCNGSCAGYVSIYEDQRQGMFGEVF